MQIILTCVAENSGFKAQRVTQSEFDNENINFLNFLEMLLDKEEQSKSIGIL